jgi:hypothetical protein
MRSFEKKKRWSVMATVLSSVLVAGGCTSFKYAFDMKTSFAEQKSYTWASATYTSQTGHLLESNVQVLADQLLTQKGFQRTSGKADLEMTIDFASSGYQDKGNYEISQLTLAFYSTGKKELVWRGTAFGTIKVDAASDDLKKAVEGILSNFPPKGKS